jgi:hypothetical protein
MPVVSEAQRRAMYAAKEGHSTLGIPKKVGAEFIAATPKGADLPARAKADSQAPHIHNYLGAVVKGDSAGMATHAKKFDQGKYGSEK